MRVSFQMTLTTQCPSERWVPELFALLRCLERDELQLFEKTCKSLGIVISVKNHTIALLSLPSTYDTGVVVALEDFESPALHLHRMSYLEMFGIDPTFPIWIVGAGKIGV